MSKPAGRCSFCGKPQDDVKKLIAAPGVFICDECVSLCNEILTEEMDEPWGWVPAPQAEPRPWPLGSAHFATYFEMPPAITWQRPS